MNEARVLRVEGRKIYLEGHPYPLKGIPTQEAVHAIDIVKKLILSWPWISLKRIKKLSLLALRPYILKQEDMTECAGEVRTMIPNEWGLIISHILEYDSAYRLRLEHIFKVWLSTYDGGWIGKNPYPFLTYALDINRKNDYIGVHLKVRKIVWMLRLFLLWPLFKKKWIAAFRKCNFKNLMLDDIDMYWLSIRTDYSTGNKNPIV